MTVHSSVENELVALVVAYQSETSSANRARARAQEAQERIRGIIFGNTSSVISEQIRDIATVVAYGRDPRDTSIEQLRTEDWF